MVRRIVLDQIDFAGTITAQRPFEIVDVGLGVENGLEVIKEASAVQFDVPNIFKVFLCPVVGICGCEPRRAQVW